MLVAILIFVIFITLAAFGCNGNLNASNNLNREMIQKLDHIVHQMEVQRILDSANRKEN